MEVFPIHTKDLTKDLKFFPLINKHVLCVLLQAMCSFLLWFFKEMLYFMSRTGHIPLKVAKKHRKESGSRNLIGYCMMDVEILVDVLSLM